MRDLIALIAVVSSGCLGSASVLCADGRTCPAGTVCDDVHHLCVSPYQLTSCGALVDGDECKLAADATTSDGECHGNVCLSQVCGDAVITHDEACEGAAPAVGTCVDFEFDRGPLVCSALCTEGFDACKRVGWHMRTFKGIGTNAAIWEDGGIVWIANQNGIGRCDATECTLDRNMIWHTGIWAGAGHVFAVTHDGRARHFDGLSWTEQQLPVAPPPPPTEPQIAALTAVWGRSPSDVYAVGRGGKIFHFDGSTWSDTDATTEHLRAVWGTASIVFAVGDNNSILRNDGNSWQPVSLAIIGTIQFTGVWGSDSTQVLAVGETDGIGAVVDLGSAVPRALQLPTGTAPISAVSGRSASELYLTTAAGEILFFDGLSWTRMLKEPTESLRTIFAGPTAVYAAGLSDLFMQYDNVGWVESPVRPSTNIGLSWGASLDHVFAQQGCWLYEFNGVLWVEQPLPACVPCNEGPPATGVNFWLDMFGSSATDVYVGGPYGQILHRDAVQWSCVSLPASVLGANPMWSQGGWASSPSSAYVVGGSGNGTVLYAVRYNGSTWQDISDQLRPHMDYAFDVWGSGPSDVYVVGNTSTGVGRVAHYNGSTWTTVDTNGAEVQGRAIWGSGPSDVFVVGSASPTQGAIMHFDGSTWTQVSVPQGVTQWTTGPYVEVTGTGPNDVYVISVRTLLHYDGTSWYPIRRPDATPLTGVQAIGGQVFVSGFSGVGLRLVGDLTK